MCKTIQLTTHKFFEAQLDRFRDSGFFFDFQCCWRTKCDHAGFEFTIEIAGFYFGIKIYDNRHWNYDTNDWVSYSDEE